MATPSLRTIIGNSFVRRDGTTVSFDNALRDKDLVAIYFSAHWCGPCRSFTPLLQQTYQQWKRSNQKIEVIFASSDQDAASFANYFGSDHGDWLAFPFNTEKSQSMVQRFQIRGIPALVVLDSQGNVVDASARKTLSTMRSAAIQQWMRVSEGQAPSQWAVSQPSGSSKGSFGGKGECTSNGSCHCAQFRKYM